MLFRFLGSAEEDGVFAAWAAGGAGGPAIDVCGANGENEFAVGSEITLQCGAPVFGGGLWVDSGWL
jgi:hypothetical protein